MRSFRFFFMVAFLLSAAFLRTAFSAGSLQMPDRTFSRTRVLLIYVDGLRPDNVDEMVAENQLPNIEDLFYLHGLRVPSMFTVFPSNTVISNSLFMSGKWPSNSGVKCQALFERFEVPGQKNLQHFVDRIGAPKGYPRYFNMLTQTDVVPHLLKKNRIRTFYDYLGEGFKPSVVPIHPYAAPVAWPHVATNAVPHFYRVTTEAVDEIDSINADFAMQYMISDDRADVFLIWFPGLDEAQHADPYGQFGAARKYLVDADQSIGRIRGGLLRAMRKDERLITLLFSDHGAYGGKDGVFNQPFHIGRDYFYQQLKMNVRGPDFSYTHPGTDHKTYAFVDNMGRGQAKIYLPVADSTSGNWSRKNSFYELEHYRLGPNRDPVNLISELAAIDLSSRNKLPGTTDPHPVDILIVKISDQMLFLGNQRGAEALIQVSQAEDGTEVFRYTPVSDFHQKPDGALTYNKTTSADPLSYWSDPGFQVPLGTKETFFSEAHDAGAWLRASYQSQYPDAVVALAKSIFWNRRYQRAELSRDPDILLSAAPGWNFRIEDIESADHGSLRADSMRVTFMISGPGIRTGIAEEPHRLIELTPTVFDLIQYSQPTDFDQPPMKDIYE